MINFDINSSEKISNLFREHHCIDFISATDFVRNLPYKRNRNKEDLSTVFVDNCGTCSTKHALLKLLIDENNQQNFKLILGIFKMNGINTPKIKSVLEKYHLDYIPEAHNYLKYKNEILDFTNKNSSKEDFADDLLYEIEIQPNQINEFKIEFHKNYLKDWLLANPQISFTLDELWKIRELCIEALS